MNTLSLTDLFESAYNAMLSTEDDSKTLWFNFPKRKVVASNKRPAGHPADSFRLTLSADNETWGWDRREPLFRKWLASKVA